MQRLESNACCLSAAALYATSALTDYNSAIDDLNGRVSYSLANMLYLISVVGSFSFWSNGSNVAERCNKLSYQFRGAIFNGLLCQLPNSSLGNLWRTSVGRFFRGAIFRWMYSPTSEFFFWQSLTHMSCEIFSWSDPRAPRGEVFKSYLLLYHWLSDLAGSKCRRIEGISVTDVLAYHWCTRQAKPSQVGSRQYS